MPEEMVQPDNRSAAALKELQGEVLSTNACTSCGTCSNLCPYIVSVNDRVTALNNCRITTGRCYSYCPRTSPKPELANKLFGDAGYGGDLGPYLEYGMARSTYADKKANFQYGGVVTTLLIKALEDGLVNGAVVNKMIDNQSIVITTDSKEEILAAAGSKFALLPTNKEVNRSNANPDSQLITVALPCQATGLRKKQLLTQHDVEANSGTIILGLFCTWALTQQGWRSLLNDYVGNDSVTKVDIPPPPANVMEITTNNKSHLVPLDQVRKFVRPGCHTCMDMTAENADISIGMVENSREYNTVIIRTRQGKELVESAVKAGYLEFTKLPETSWDHLSEASLNKKKKAITYAENQSEQLPYFRRLINLKSSIWR